MTLNFLQRTTSTIILGVAVLTANHSIKPAIAGQLDGTGSYEYGFQAVTKYDEVLRESAALHQGGSIIFVADKTSVGTPLKGWLPSPLKIGSKLYQHAENIPSCIGDIFNGKTVCLVDAGLFVIESAGDDIVKGISLTKAIILGLIQSGYCIERKGFVYCSRQGILKAKEAIRKANDQLVEWVRDWLKLNDSKPLSHSQKDQIIRQQDQIIKELRMLLDQLIQGKAHVPMM